MDQTTLAALLTFLARMDPELLFRALVFITITPFGVIALMILLWFFNERKSQRVLTVYREDVRRLTTYYENNVELVKAWEKVANGLQDTVVLNTRTLQKMVDVCLNNQYCPNARMPRQEGRENV